MQSGAERTLVFPDWARFTLCVGGKERSQGRCGGVSSARVLCLGGEEAIILESSHTADGHRDGIVVKCILSRFGSGSVYKLALRRK